MTTADPADVRQTRGQPLPQNLGQHRVFLAAIAGVVMLHVADDNFLQPAAGVSAGDHLVSGLVPLGLLSLAAATYPRVRAGARAAIALLIGFTGLVVGLIEAGYAATTEGPSGDDYTGFLAAAAGAC